MLSRVAKGMYWLGRHIERAENITRILDVNRRMNLETEYFSDLDVWSPVIAIMRATEQFDALHQDVNERNVYRYFLLSEDNPESVLSSLRQARETARTMRERISEEMWEHLNHMFIELNSMTIEQVVFEQSAAFNRRIKTFCNAFHGYADNTMIHGKPWYFLKMGSFIERAQMTCRILEIKYYILLPSLEEVGRPLDIHQWQALLRSASSYEAYRRIYKAEIVPAHVVELLIVNPIIPRSVHNCMQQTYASLRGIGACNVEQFGLLREVESYLHALRETSGEKIIADGLKEYLEYIQGRNEAINALIHRCYFDLLTFADVAGREHTISAQMPQQQ